MLGKNSIVDSYNSDDGTYEETQAYSDGSIATNGPIIIPKNSNVYGDANPGEDYPFSEQPANVSGSWGTLQAPLAYDPIPQETLDGDIVAVSDAGAMDAAKIDNNNNNIVLGDPVNDPWPLDEDGNLSVGPGKTITLPGGGTAENPAKYYFKSVTVSPLAVMNVSGEGQFAAIYVDGGDLSPGTMTVSGTSTIYVGSGSLNVNNPVTVSGPSTIYVGGNLNVDSTLAVSAPSSTLSSIYVQKTTADGGNISVGLHGVVNLSGEMEVYMNRGSSYVTGGDLSVETQGDLTVSGKTTFYIDGGNITIETQGDINIDGVPKNLTIYSTGTIITLMTQADFYGAIYAPNAVVSLSAKTAAGEMYGAIACDSFVSGTNTGVHFDKALLNESPLFLDSRVTSWQEIQQ